MMFSDIGRFVFIFTVVSAQTTETAMDTRTSCSRVGQVQNVQIFEVGSSLVVVWQEPKHSGQCNLTYRISYDLKQSAEVSDLHYAFDYESILCIASYVTITAVDEKGLEGPSLTQQYNTEFGGVKDLSVTQNNDKLFVEWEKPSNSERCNFTYLVQYGNYFEHFKDIVLDSNFSTHNLLWEPCSNITVRVTPISNSTLGTYAEKQYEIEPHGVENFKVTSQNFKVVTTWDPPANSNRCNLSYEVVHFEKDCFVREISVLQLNGFGWPGNKVTSDVEIEVGPVLNLNVTQVGVYMVATWEPPLGSQRCTLAYLVDYTDGIETHTSVVTESKLIFGYACGTVEVTVTPEMKSGRKAMNSTVSHRGDC